MISLYWFVGKTSHSHETPCGNLDTLGSKITGHLLHAVLVLDSTAANSLPVPKERKFSWWIGCTHSCMDSPNYGGLVRWPKLCSHSASITCILFQKLVLQTQNCRENRWENQQIVFFAWFRWLKRKGGVQQSNFTMEYYFWPDTVSVGVTYG